MKTKGNLPMMNAVSILLTILHLWKQDSICTDSNKDSEIQSYTKAECKLFMNSPGTHQDKPQEAIFDSDSFLIQVDSGASCSISNCKAHFKLLKLIDPKDPHNIYGLTGEESHIKGKGTLKWKIEDDDSDVHTI
jgi:hypothetical protein